jgi:hypothetical protein
VNNKIQFRFLLALCVSLAIGLALVHPRKPVPTTSPSNNADAADQSASAPTPDPLPNVSSPEAHFVANPQFAQDSETAPESKPAIAPPPAPDSKQKIAAMEAKDQLLRDLRVWAAKDPEAALASVLKLPPGNDRNEALASVCFGLAESDPADAVETAQSLHLENQPGDVMGNLVQQWATADVSSALDWANDQPPGAQRDSVMSRVALVLSQAAPSDAADLVVNQIPPGPAQDEAVMTVVNQWGNQDLAAAAAWVKNFPEGPLQARAVSELEGIAQYQRELARQ